eukprot:3670492-Amphidinium_carterae.1
MVGQLPLQQGSPVFIVFSASEASEHASALGYALRVGIMCRLCSRLYDAYEKKRLQGWLVRNSLSQTTLRTGKQ